MASLLLTAVGTAIGGPIGGALGAVLGRAVDQQIFGSGPREGPRLQELSVTTSSYGQPIARQFGKVRTAGTIIWSTDLVEQSETSGGGKGAGSTTSYTYSASFAVALSSTPISGIGRIWADGGLLRGTAGDLKVEGEMRTYLGTGDTPVDPLIAAIENTDVPGFRDLAYVVFEDLSLASFGNRIPALSFEVFGETSESEGSAVSLMQIIPAATSTNGADRLDGLAGLSDQGGAIKTLLMGLNSAYPLSSVTTGEELLIELADRSDIQPVTLPEQLHSPDNTEGEASSLSSATEQRENPLSLRYYDLDRDYQPGVQRAIGRRMPGRERMVDLPATMAASDARALVTREANRHRWRSETRTVQIGELDLAVRPGACVVLPDRPGRWRVLSWEWEERGIALTLERLSPVDGIALNADPGSFPEPPDLAAVATVLRVFETPAFSTTASDSPVIYAAASAESQAWQGAAMYSDSSVGLSRIGSIGPSRSKIGSLLEPLAVSSGMMLEEGAEAVVELVAEDLELPNTTIEGLANGDNRVLVGGEVLQYLTAEAIGPAIWRLKGLLRRRGATEDQALLGHNPGTSVVLLDNSLLNLSASAVSVFPTTAWAAIGIGDNQPSVAALSNEGLSIRPAAVVHPCVIRSTTGDLAFTWTRRARGQWLWSDSLEVPLVEQNEAYLIGYGDEADPHAHWQTAEPQFELDIAAQGELVAMFGEGPLWVKQIGTYSNSAATFLTSLV